MAAPVNVQNRTSVPDRRQDVRTRALLWFALANPHLRGTRPNMPNHVCLSPAKQPGR